MSASQEESVASLRLLVCIAKADGVLHDKEREALQASLGEMDGPALELDTLLAEDLEVGELVDRIGSDEAREQAFASAYAMAHADGECSAQEQAVLDALKSAWSIPADREAFLDRVFAGHDEDVIQGKAGAAPAFSGIERTEKIGAETRKTAIISAVLGAFPLPIIAIATDLAIFGLQIGLAKDIAKFWGKEMDTAQAKGLLGTFGVGTAARIAVTNLLKVFPGWGSAAGAAAAYASSYAVGHAVNSYYEGGEGITPADLKKEFKKAKAEGKKAYADDKAEVDAKAEGEKAHLAELSEKLKAGEISQAQFEHEVAEM